MDLGMLDQPSSTEDDRIVSIHTRRRLQPAGGQPQSAPPADELAGFERSGEPDDFRHRTMVNAIAFLFVAGLVIAGIWLADTLTTMRKTQDCVLAGKRNCAAVDAPAQIR
jgi:hypothetical protein